VTRFRNAPVATPGTIRHLLGAAAFACAVASSSGAFAHGAVAVGVTANTTADGVAIGVTWDMPDERAARGQALRACRTYGTASEAARERCEVVKVFSHQCVSVAIDPDPGSAGWGWAVAPGGDQAEAMAIGACRTHLTQFCFLSVRNCDTKP
jgi:hypothetical protein